MPECGHQDVQGGIRGELGGDFGRRAFDFGKFSSTADTKRVFIHVLNSHFLNPQFLGLA
jgi:hypothetical protein